MGGYRTTDQTDTAQKDTQRKRFTVNDSQSLATSLAQLQWVSVGAGLIVPSQTGNARARYHSARTAIEV